MRPVEVSIEEIVSAGNQLASEGKNITGFAIRRIISRGNPDRLKSVWDEHLKQENPQKFEKRAPLPEGIEVLLSGYAARNATEMQALALELNQRSFKATEIRVTEVLRSLEELRSNADAEIKDATQTLSELEIQLESSLEKERALRVDLNNALQREAEVREICAQLRGKCEALEQQRAELHQKLKPVNG